MHPYVAQQLQDDPFFSEVLLLTVSVDLVNRSNSIPGTTNHN